MQKRSNNCIRNYNGLSPPPVHNKSRGSGLIFDGGHPKIKDLGQTSHIHPGRSYGEA